LRKAVGRLKAAGVESAGLDARLLLQAIGGLSYAAILSGRAELSAEAQARFAAAIARRAAHEPVHRILGRRAFYGREFALSRETLEPRPDTEALIELLLPYIHARAAAQGKTAATGQGKQCAGKENFTAPKAEETGQSTAERTGRSKPAANYAAQGRAERAEQGETAAANAPLTLLDIGTGSGIIALTFLAEAPQLIATGADISAEALNTAAANARALGLEPRFTAIHSDCFAAIPARYDFIVSNPPYIPHGEIARLSAEVRQYDPLRALDGGADGLNFYRILAAQSAAHLKPGGYIAVEIGAGQRADVGALFAAAGFSLTASRRDLGGIERALLFSLAKAG